MDEIKQVTVICTDTDKVFGGEIIREGKDTLRVVMEGYPINFEKYNNKGLYVANYQGMEFTIQM